MSTGKHTTVRLEVIGCLVRTGLEHGGYLVADCRDAGGLPHSDEAKANAVLFAAGHDMLAALRVAEDAVGDLKALEVVRAAIVKATGSRS